MLFEVESNYVKVLADDAFKTDLAARRSVIWTQVAEVYALEACRNDNWDKAFNDMINEEASLGRGEIAPLCQPLGVETDRRS